VRRLATYTTLPDASLAQDKPLTQSIARAFRDNPLAIAQNDASAPAIVGVNPDSVQTASASAALTFTNLLALDLIEFELMALRPASTGAALHMQVSTNNGSTWITNYIYMKNIAEVVPAGTTASALEGGYNDTKIVISRTGTDGVNNTTGNSLNGVVQLYCPGSTAFLKGVTWTATHSNNNTSGTAIINGGCTIAGVAAANPINAVKFFFVSGNITSGKIAMRGRRAA
jgi:hypothetical protein